jgi:hypothetical protein
MSQLRSIIGQAHFTVARSMQSSIDYCKKEGDFVEFGDRPVTDTNRGRRNDLESFKDAVRGGMLDYRDIAEHHSAVWAKYRTFCREYIAMHSPEVELEQHPMRPWQQSLSDILDGTADDRTVIFVVDPVGCMGKSWFAHQYCRYHPGRGQVLTPGRKADMAYALEQSIDVLFVDAPRSKQGEYLQYDFLEDVKNGYVFSTKYESRVKRLRKMHVVVMMNECPDMTKLSEDRYHIINLEDE